MVAEMLAVLGLGVLVGHDAQAGGDQPSPGRAAEENMVDEGAAIPARVTLARGDAGQRGSLGEGIAEGIDWLVQKINSQQSN